MTSPGLNELIDALRRPGAYPHPAGDITVHQTHISVVFLAGDYAYKIKKPVDLGFVDYSTLERRRHFCDEEVKLNRRLAPDVYLGVVPIVRDGSAMVFDTGRPDRDDAIEWAVRMKRLPADRTLEALLETDAASPSLMQRIAGHVAEFHADAAGSEEINEFGQFDVVANNARDNFEQSRDQVGHCVSERVFERLEQLNEDTLEALRPLIEQRARDGRTRDTHGDLRLDHVYILEDRGAPVVVDCIEFNPAFRFADPVSDTAFLAMDLIHAGRRDLAAAFAEAWFRAAGDDEGRRLLAFYVAYRAAVRGKVQGIKALSADLPEADRDRAMTTARGHWLVALGELEPPRERPGLVLIGGLPGTGKTTLARALAREADFELIRSDVVRKELAGLSPEERAGDDYGEGLYSAEMTERTYGACREKAAEILFRGGRAIVDASFHEEHRRRAMIDTAIEHGCRVSFLVCEADSAVTRERLAARRGDASDADWDVHRQMAQHWQPAYDATGRVTRAVDTGGDEAASREAALSHLAGLGLW